MSCNRVPGMLSGAILGNVFASPSVSSILAAIRVAAGPQGVLLIVKNYTGDRLNFGIAAQRAKSEGILVEMVLVDDDCALPKGKGITGSRGVAGTILVHKIAGAAARRGYSLGNVKKAAEEAINRMGTLGVALSLCSVPGSKSCRVLPENSIEMAIGIHGEPGIILQLSDYLTPLSEKVAAQILEQIIDSSRTSTNAETRITLGPGAEIAVLINNLGGISQLELLVFTRDILKSFQSRDIKVTRCYSGSLMTSLDMAGVSVTVFQYNPMMLSFLDELTSAPAWIPSSMLDNPSPLDSKRISHPLPPQTQEAQIAGPPCPSHTPEILSLVCEQLILNEPTLTQYDQVCGDGDCGLTIKAGAQHILKKSRDDSLALSDTSSFLSQLADGVSESMGGTSGILLEIMFHSMALSVKEQYQPHQEPIPDPVLWSNALQSGIESVCFYGGATEGMRTLLDSLLPASRKLSQLLSQASSPWNMEEILREVALEAEQGMERTKSLTSAAGRSNYISHEVLMGTPDPGAYAVFLVFQSISQFYQKHISA
jgi:triose/dihydroxyacetone kinase / FAD-AMP lyase (cyclizing)